MIQTSAFAYLAGTMNEQNWVRVLKISWLCLQSLSHTFTVAAPFIPA